ncbi:MAG: ATP-grasp domain-containing protein [Candidatus Diapherotrites archaeon]|nr:ATP-grasp domain-containing protein [Candidatus Diapherotrites archaeon]
MNILLIAEKKTQVALCITALKNRGVESNYLRVSKITIVSTQNKTTLKSLGEELDRPNAVFIQTRASFAPFIEPMLEELEKLKCYTSAKRGAYYFGWNEPFQFVTLAQKEVSVPKTITTASIKNLEQTSKKISYPVIVKTFSGKKAQQAIIISSAKELNLFAKSIKSEIDAFLIAQFIEGDVISSTIIGNKVFSIKRKTVEGSTQRIREGKSYKLSEEDTNTVINAARAGGLDIARVDMIRGKIIKVDPFIPLEEFNIACAENLEEYIADRLIEMSENHKIVEGPNSAMLELKRFFSKIIHKKTANRGEQ